MARPTGGTQHPDPLAGRVRVRRMSGSAERRRQGTLPAQGPSATAPRSATAAPRRDSCRPTLPDGTARAAPDAQPSVGTHQTDVEWSGALEVALTATRRDDLKHGTNTAYVAGSVCKECRE
jgi:hypothetical protein